MLCQHQAKIRHAVAVANEQPVRNVRVCESGKRDAQSDENWNLHGKLNRKVLPYLRLHQLEHNTQPVVATDVARAVDVIRLLVKKVPEGA